MLVCVTEGEDVKRNAALAKILIYFLCVRLQMLKKMESAKKKAEAVVDTVDISEKEKMSALKRYGKPPPMLCIYLSAPMLLASMVLASWLATTNEPSLLSFRPPTASTRRRAWGRRRSGR